MTEAWRASPVDRGERSVELRSMIELWRSRAEEAGMQAWQVGEGSVSYEMMLTIAETYHRLARWEEKTSRAISPPDHCHFKPSHYR